MDNVTEDTFLLFAARHYDSTSACKSMDEFREDLSRVKYIKRLITRYKAGDELRDRLILNHMIVLYNTFGPAATQLLLVNTKEIWPILMPFMKYLGWLPELVRGVGDEVIDPSSVTFDEEIIKRLAKI